MPCLPRRNRHLCDGGGGGIGIAHFHAYGLGSLVACSGSRHGDPGRSGTGRFKAETDHGVPRDGERDLGLSAAGNCQGTFHAYADRGLLDCIVESENIDRKGDLLSCPYHPGKGRENHERGFYLDGLLGVAVGIVTGRDYHHPDAADIHRELELMAGRASLERERSDELDHRIEAVVLLRTQHDGFVASYAEHRREPSAEGSDHIVIEVPGLHSESLPFVHGLPWVGGLVAGKVKQAFIHHGEGIGHLLPVFFTYLDCKVFFRFQHVRHRDDGIEVGVLVVHQDRLHSIEPDGEVVVRPFMRLDEGNMDVETRRHLGSHLERAGGVALSRDLHPLA